MHLTNGHTASEAIESLSYLTSDSNGAASRDVPDRLPFTVEMFEESVCKYPDNIALVCAHQAPDLYGIPSVPNPGLEGLGQQRRPYLRWTFQSLKSGVDRLRAGLRPLGVARGTAVVTLMPNCAEYVLVWWAARRMGLVMAPLNPRNLSNKDEVAHMLDIIVKGTGGRPPILLVFDQEVLEAEPLRGTPFSVQIVVSPAGRNKGSPGVLLSDLMANAGAGGGDGQDEQPTDDEIMFTSGSTSRPKPVKIQHPTLTLGMYNFTSTPGCERRPGDLWLAMTPNNHGMGRSAITSSMCSGGGTVYPGFFFDVAEAADVLVMERCTHAALVPTLIRLLGDAVGSRLRDRAQGGGGGGGRRRDSLLRTAFLSGAPPTPADLQTCSDVFGIETITSIYGMTEGAEANTAGLADWASLVGADGTLSVGTPRSRGAALKVCAPGAAAAAGPGRGRPLPRGTPGEIHYCGPERLPSPTVYMDRPDADDFCYVDERGRRWLVTGDMGVVGADDGQLRLVGWAKDMIIRGGENMAPAAIEACLAANPALARLAVQVVGAPDPVAGEVPVAVVAAPAPDVRRLARELHDTVARGMGPMFVPAKILALETLGLKDWPRTLTGKIKRVEVAEVVARHLKASEQESEFPRDRVATDVLGIWAQSVGLEEDSLSVDQPIAEFADSLTIARVIRRIKRTIAGCGDLSPQDMLRAKTIKEQMGLVARLATLNGDPGHARREDPGPTQRGSPPVVEDMVHLTENPNLLDQTKQLVAESIVRDGFEWDDVEDVFPVQCCVSDLGRNGVVDSARFHIADVMTGEKDVERVKQAVQTMLSHNRILASYVVWDKDGRFGLEPELALHVTLRHNEKLFDRVIQPSGPVKSVQALQALALNCPEPTRSLLHGILFRALLYKVEETGTVGLLYIVSHAVLDASSIWMFQEDLECVLSGKPLRPHVDYKLWADTYYSFRGSPQARASVDWHARYLDGIQAHLDRALWPPVPERGPLDPTGGDYPTGVHYSFRAPNIVLLRRRYPHLTAPVILKSVLALLMVWHTGHTHAVFESCEDGRTRWPFAPPSAGRLLGDAQDVAGPTIQFVTNLAAVVDDPFRTVAGFLGAMQADQDGLTRHAHAPWPDVERALGCRPGLLRRVFTTVKFNWVPGFGAQAQTDRDRAREPFRHLRILAAVARWRIGLLARFGLGGLNNDTVVMHLMGDALGGDDKVLVAKRLENLTLWLTDPANWEAPVGNFREAMAKDGELVVDAQSKERMTRNLGLSCLMSRES